MKPLEKVVFYFYTFLREYNYFIEFFNQEETPNV